MHRNFRFCWRISIFPKTFPPLDRILFAMSILQSIILGLVQGLAEFLPVSSSGHLVLFKDILGLSEVPLLFDIVLHLATLLALVIVFRKRIWAILAAIGRWLGRRGKAADGENLAIVIPALIATAVTGVMGYAIAKFLPAEGPRAVSVELFITGLILLASAFLKPGLKGYRELGPLEALVVGIGQGLGVFSGISRSGLTISAGLAAGMKREEAGEFAFLLAIPAILGAFVFELKDASSLSMSVPGLELGIASLAAFLSGILALKLLMRIVKGGKLAWFALYLLPLGLLGFFLF